MRLYRFLDIEAMLLESGAQSKSDLWVCSVLLPRTRSMSKSMGLEIEGRWTMGESRATKKVVCGFGDEMTRMKRRRFWLRLTEWEVCMPRRTLSLRAVLPDLFRSFCRPREERRKCGW